METRTLDVALTEREMIERSKMQAELVKEINDAESSKKAEMKKLADKVNELNRQLQLIAREVRAGKKWVEVEISRQKDLARGVEEVIRCDTGEIVETRTLSPQERQLELIQPEKKKKAN